MSCSTPAESDWYYTRGQVDKIVQLSGNKVINVEEVLDPTSCPLSLRVVIDGPPGIGKTTLCRKLLNMWSNGTLGPQQYDLVLYCPLRNSKIATATTLAGLFEYESSKVPKAFDWFRDRDGEGLLIIFDGWDELSEQDRESSLAAKIIHRKNLDQCSVIVTSRSYASSSLLKMDTLSRHVQVIGFSQEEISTVIIQTLQKDTKLAQKLIDENTEQDTEEAETDKKPRLKYKLHLTTAQSSEDSQLAVKLINDLKVRGDVRSLCYVPLVCSMVILVYCKEGGHLPTTLTQLYENFILQTIRRHMNKHDINPRTLGSLSSLPSQLARPLQEMCQLAYTNLANRAMVFSLHEIQLLSEAVKEDYLGLMTTFTEYDEEKYQFLHLSIQEFLAAWWIAKHEEKTEEVFKHHFDDDHFRMCLRFVAGLTHLEHDSYQQYFNKKEIQLQCKRKPLLNTYLPHFYQNPLIRQTVSVIETFHVFYELDNVPILHLQLLYESQNETLCQVLAKSMNENSLCLHIKQRVSTLSLFDWLCLGFFINNSKIEWDHLHLGVVPNQALSVFTDKLANSLSETKCKRLEVWLHEPNARLINQILEPSLFYNIHECYFELFKGTYVPCLVLLQFLNLPQVKILHLIMEDPDVPTIDDIDLCYTDKSTELEKCIAVQVKLLEEMNFNYRGTEEITGTLVSVIRGVELNKTITSLSLSISVRQKVPPARLPNGAIEQLLKDNNTLQALSLDIPDELLPSSLNIVEVNTPLTALEIGEESSELMTSSLLPHIKGLHCLILHEPYPPRLLFCSYPSLHTLTLPLDTAESATELFTILQTNTTLKTLNVEIEESVYTSKCNMGTSLQVMLTQNKTIEYFEINNDIPSSFLPFLTAGLRHNTSIKHLNVYIPLNTGVTYFIEAISKKDNLKEINLNFILELDQSYSCSEEQIMTPLFYEHLLPAVTSMLQSHTTIIELRIGCTHINGDWSEPHWIELVKKLYDTIFIHPSLEYIEFNKNCTTRFTHPPLEDTLKDQEVTLIERHRNEQPGKPLPIVDLNIIKLIDT
uniref:NACHT domain-containing protein n=1 Tax=Amphimedon queenslandica TaxID=400682 RepID=A0A1X7U9M6_AMPQE